MTAQLYVVRQLSSEVSTRTAVASNKILNDHPTP